MDRHSNPDPDGDYWIEREDGHRIASTDRKSRSEAYRQLCVHAKGCEEGTGTIVVRNRADLNARQSGEGEREALRDALDAAHFYIDASPDELADLGITRDDALRMARDKRAAIRATDDAGGA